MLIVILTLTTLLAFVTWGTILGAMSEKQVSDNSVGTFAETGVHAGPLGALLLMPVFIFLIFTGRFQKWSTGTSYKTIANVLVIGYAFVLGLGTHYIL